ncbi:MAG: hypothetical protein MJ170_03510 [Alphaproteobacteria bacterium]|nr:hypothetical protein [Alphaproteobacteria bacterium]
MQKVSYMGDGSTTEFYFNFPFFENSNVVVTVNNEPATGYYIIGTSGGIDADIPYIGGKVVFEIAPTSIDCITIARQLPLERIVDYQPLSKIDPTTLNQDLNYLMEVIKDRKDELADLTTKYTEIADKESTDIILARISAIHEEIVDIDAKIQALGDIGTLQQRVTDLTTTVGGHTTSIGALDTTVGGHTTSINGLDTRTTGMIDYVIESQAPTAENNYTWYRKYKSGWVEQGGAISDILNGYSTKRFNLPVNMSDTKYCAFIVSCKAGDLYTPRVLNKSTTYVEFGYIVNSTQYGATWTVMGVCE